MKIEFKKIVSKILIISSILTLISCAKPYSEKEILCKYDDLNCLYYVKDSYKKYKYSDYIFDDVSNGLYQKSTPNIADYRIGSGMLDYDIESYVNARMDYAIKVDLIKKYEIKLDEICAAVHDDYFEQRNSYVYYYDLNTNKNTLLYDGEATNISYDDEIPTISFDILPNGENNAAKDIEGRRIMLSDIIAANTTIEGYMKIYLGTGKERVKFFLDKKVNDEEILVASASELKIKSKK